MNEVYHQMTLDEWMESKKRIREMIRTAKTAFIVIGYELRKIEESEAYRMDGYESLAEFAKTEYGFDKTMTSRLIDVNKAFSEGGYSDILIDDAEGFTFTKLVEMKDLEREDLGLLRPQVKREDIRELKSFENSAPEDGGIDELLIEFFRKEKDTLNEVFGGMANGTIREAAEIGELISPSGNRAFRKGMWMAFFYGDKALFKERGGGIQEMSYEELYEKLKRIYEDAAAAGARTWEAYYGEPEKEEAAEEKAYEEARDVNEPEDQGEEDTAKPGSEEDKPQTKSDAKKEKSVTKEEKSVVKEAKSDDETEKTVSEEARDDDEKTDAPVAPAQLEEEQDREAEEQDPAEENVETREETVKEKNRLAARIDEAVELLTEEIGNGRYAAAIDLTQRLIGYLRDITALIRHS